MDNRKILQEKLNESYGQLTKQWLASSPNQLIAAAEEIAAAQFLHGNMVNSITEADAAVLLQYDSPLEVIRDKWIEENGSGAVHDDDLAHCVFSLSVEQQAKQDQDATHFGVTLH